MEDKRPPEVVDGELVGSQPSFLRAAADAIALLTAGKSDSTKRAYQSRVKGFIAWYRKYPPSPELRSKANWLTLLLGEYIDYMQAEGKSPRTVQAHVTTLRNLIAAMADAGYEEARAQLDTVTRRVTPPPTRGDTHGKRLTLAQAGALIAAPRDDTLKGLRDKSILAILVTCGLRRSEVCALSWKHIEEIEGHKVIQNLRGKHGRTRTVKLQPQLWRLLMAWGTNAELEMTPNAPVFVRVRRGDHVQHGERLTANAVAYLVKHYAKHVPSVPSDIAPHDLRRTAAALSRKGGATIEQIQHMLGHASPQTTSRYIGATLDLDDHAADYINVPID
jgi:integrase